MAESAVKTSERAQALWRALLEWAEERRAELAVAAATLVAFLALYWLTGLGAFGSTDYADYAFGTDVPAYAHEDGVLGAHYLMTKLFNGYKKIMAALLGAPLAPAVMKLPFAVMGALNVGVAIGAFAALFGRLNWRAILCGACCGLTLMVWYYAALPESYMLSTLLYAAYLALFVRVATSGVTDALGGLMAFVFFVTLFNDISSVIMLLAPTAYFGLAIAREPMMRRIVGYHTIGLALFLTHQALTTDLVAYYSWLFNTYTPFSESAAAEEPRYVFAFWQPAVAFFLHALAAPSTELTYAPWTEYPNYFGFFAPSPFAYFTSIQGVLFVLAYAGVLAFIRLRHIDRLAIALLIVVLVRAVLAQVFNPVETIIYASVATLPFFLVILRCVENSGFARRGVVLGVFAATLALANGAFLFSL